MTLPQDGTPTRGVRDDTLPQWNNKTRECLSLMYLLYDAFWGCFFWDGFRRSVDDSARVYHRIGHNLGVAASYEVGQKGAHARNVALPLGKCPDPGTHRLWKHSPPPTGELLSGELLLRSGELPPVLIHSTHQIRQILPQIQISGKKVYSLIAYRINEKRGG